MPPDIGRLYQTMLRARATELASAELWHDGLISGELHSGVGEEAVAVGVVDHLRDGDGLAVDHRGTAPFVARGVAPVDLLAEMVGAADGLCGGRAGHMHLADPERRIIADGIVGASAPTACGFGLEAKLARKGAVAVAFFGEGATNQGMLLEALNLAVVWRLPVVFVCKQSGLAITTSQSEAIGGSLLKRARGFGMPARRVRGNDVERVWHAAERAIARARRGRGPTFLLAPVHRPEGHLLGDPLLRLFRDPIGQAGELGLPLLAAWRVRSNASRLDRVRGVGKVISAGVVAAREALAARNDPLAVTRRRLDPAIAAQLEDRENSSVDEAREAALGLLEVTHA